jgi:hypothetical protein
MMKAEGHETRKKIGSQPAWQKAARPTIPYGMTGGLPIFNEQRSENNDQ